MQNEKNGNKRLATLFTLFLILVTVIPCIIVFAVSAPKVTLTYEGEEISKLFIYSDGKKTVEAKTELDGTLFYQWQILANTPDADWVNISGKTDRSIDVTYALVGNLLDPAGQAQLRCTVSDGTDTYVSDALTVVVSHDVSYNSKSSVKSASKGPLMKSSAPAVANDEIKELYTITINYIYKDNTIAREPNALSIAAGTAVYQPVVNPEVVGYYPTLQEQYPGVSLVTEGDSTYTVIDVASLDAPMIINVVYMPSLVDFVVHHHRQNLLDDNYESEPYKSVVMQGYTGEPVGDCHLDIYGFHALYYERMHVAADGSTQVEIYYDRDYYLVSFDLLGGFGIDPIYTRFGSEISINTPTRPGYVFSGWTLTAVDGREPTSAEIGEYLFTDSKTKVSVDHNLSYSANWTKGTTSYTMVFWRENANDNGYSYWGSLVVDTDSSGKKLSVGEVVNAQDWASRVPTISDEAYFSYNPARSDMGVVLKGDGSSTVNVYYTRNRYTITFVAKGACAIEEKHTHGPDCYLDICGKVHQHTEECERNLTCTIPEHTTHNSDCLECGMEEHIHGVHCDGAYSCGKEEHVHSSECCTRTQHTHSKDCYPNVGEPVDEPETSGWPSYHTFPTNATNGYIARFKARYGNSYYYYIYVNGQWYKYNSTANNGAIISVDCGLVEHTHDGSACIHCDMEEHIHTSACVNCGIVEHVHSEACYKDELHVHGVDCFEYPSCQEHVHEDSCLLLVCDMPTGHTHVSGCNDSTRDSTVKLVTRKYQESLADIWPVVDENGVIYNSGQRWTPSESSYYKNVLVYISDMPADDFTLTVNVSSYNTYRMHYMLEVLPGEEYTETYNGKKFIESFVVNANYNYITRDEDFFDIKGFEQYGSNPNFNSSDQIKQSGGDVYFYYKRRTGSDVFLEFKNIIDTVATYSGDEIMYGIPLSKYRYAEDGSLLTPSYPSIYEKNAYKFEQWYTTPECFPGTEVNWDTLTMPDGALTLYAKWIPVQHTVRVFKDASLTEQIGQTIEVEHGTFLSDPGHPTNGQLIFSGWFYKDENGVEKAFIFNGIPVKGSIDIYAKWGSRVAVQYTVYYKTIDEDGNEIEIAPPTVGSTIAGQNRTFDAKGGFDLYEGYREGYFPNTANHSIVMSAETANEHTFYYVKKDGAPYTVRYLGPDGEPLLPDKVVEDNRLAVVTETFVAYHGYMPDSYQKRLVVTANPEDNVLIFNYIKDEVHAYYRVVHYWQNVDGLDYSEHSFSDIMATVGSVCAASPLKITGFDFKEAKVDGNTVALENGTVKATLGEDGMLIAFYYDRIEVEYTVEYVEYSNTSNHLTSSVTKYGLYGALVEENAKDLTGIGYSRVSDATMRITLRETGRNRIVFTYQENTVNYKYIAIFGTENGGAYFAENLGAKTGKPSGYKPTASSDFTFAGWFLDEACTTPVNPARDNVTIDSDGKLVPKSFDSDGDGVSLYSGGVFYFKFDYNFSTLIINTQGSLDAEQAFIFTVEGVAGTATEGTYIIVVVVGNGSVTIDNLRVGDYIVTDISAWSWRYSENGAQTVHVLGKTGGAATFNYTETQDKWLDGNGYNQFLIS